MNRAETWQLIEGLCDIADMHGEGTQWSERKTDNQGVQYERTIKVIEAIGTAGRMLNAISAGREPSESDIASAIHINRVAQWRRVSGK